MNEHIFIEHIFRGEFAWGGMRLLKDNKTMTAEVEAAAI